LREKLEIRNRKGFDAKPRRTQRQEMKRGDAGTNSAVNGQPRKFFATLRELGGFALKIDIGKLAFCGARFWNIFP